MYKRIKLERSLLWISYSLLGLLQKPLQNIQCRLEGKFHLTKLEIILLEISVLLPMSLGLLCTSLIKPRFCLILTGASLFMMAFECSESSWQLYVTLFFSGVFQGFLWPSILLVSHTSKYGWLAPAPGAGALLGDVLGRWIENKCNWRCVYMVLGPLGILIGALHLYKPIFQSLSKLTSVSTKSNSNWKIYILSFTLNLSSFTLTRYLPIYFVQYQRLSNVEANDLETLFILGSLIGGPFLSFYSLSFFIRELLLLNIGALALLLSLSFSSLHFPFIGILTFCIGVFHSLGEASVLFSTLSFPSIQVGTLVFVTGTWGRIFSYLVLNLFSPYFQFWKGPFLAPTILCFFSLCIYWKEREKEKEIQFGSIVRFY